MGATIEQDIMYVVGRIRADERRKLVAAIVSWLREGVADDKLDARGNVTPRALDSLAEAIEHEDWQVRTK